MSKTSKIILWCVLIVVLAMCIVLYIAAKRPAADTTYCDAGKTYAESLRPGDETPVITGGDFTITAHTSENMCTQNRASGMTETVAAQYTLARYIVTRSLYYQAVTDGYAAADAAVQQDIDDTRAAAQTADNREAYVHRRHRHDGGRLLGLDVRDAQAYAHARELYAGAEGRLPRGGARAGRDRCVA